MDINLEKILRKYDEPKKKGVHKIISLCSGLDLHSNCSSPRHKIGSPLHRDKELNKKVTILDVVEEVEPDENKKNCCRCEEILIVDDDAFNLLSLEMILLMFHFRCQKASNGLEALDFLREKKRCQALNCKGVFQLIFMDYQMPKMDGVQTTKEIMKMVDEQKIEAIPIIGCTAFTAKDEVESCLNAGMKDVIFKPINKNVIGNILKDWI